MPWHVILVKMMMIIAEADLTREEFLELLR